ncbi:MAG: flagellar hook-associated protein FlgL [Gammaproteobacteria bacterium]|nr:flagellar hook-associated protein FlgL [Gammaproteobacteria bacterium]
MRVSTSQLFQHSLRSMQAQQTKLADIQHQIASGQKNLRPSDNPADAARSLNLQQVVDQTQQYQSNINQAQGRLELEDTVLTDVTSLLQRVKDLALQANNGSLSSAEMSAVSQEVVERKEELLSLVNTRDANGDFLFSGFKGRTQAFAKSGSGDLAGVSFQGDQGIREIQVSPSRRVKDADSGSDLFLNVDSPAGVAVTAGLNNGGTLAASTAFVTDVSLQTQNRYQITFNTPTQFDLVDTTTATTVLVNSTYVAGQAIEFDGLKVVLHGAAQVGDQLILEPSVKQDVFTSMNKFIDALAASSSVSNSNTRLSGVLAESIAEFDATISKSIEFQTQVGGRLSSLDSQSIENDAYLIQLKTSLSKIHDLDYTAAISQLTQESMVLQASQAAFMKVEKISLFDFLR